jgi:murein DD-endopeptidase MepM/ murein hydrolase activator NlpD
MRRPLSLLVIHGDGTRILRVRLPRWIAHGTVAIVAAVGATMVGLSGDYLFLKRESAQFPALRQCVADERAFHAFQPQVAAVRSEIKTWKVLHAKMWRAFGPAEDLDLTPAVAGAPDDHSRQGSGQLRPAQELDLLTSSVAQEGPRLRELEHMIGHMGKIMNALPLRWPVHGHITSNFGLRRSPWGGGMEHHRGLDIRSPPGTPVKSPGAATVAAVSSHGGYGKNVVLDHGNGVRSRYAHLKKLEVREGEQVERGQVIGLVGSTGRSTGPHLHYEILVQGKPVNPQGFLLEH